MKKENRGKTAAVLMGALLTLVCCFLFEGKLLPAAKKTSAPAGGSPLLVLAYGEVSADKSGKEITSLDSLRSDLVFLTENGYTFVNGEDLVSFATGVASIPEKAVWLTFDEGHESFYNLVFPLLQEYKAKADVNIVGSYTDLYSENLEPRDNGYLSWMQAAFLDDSPLVSIGNMSYDLNEESFLGGRKGASIKKKEDYESYRIMLCQDVLTLQQEMNENLSHDSRVFCYPKGFYCEESEKILTSELGFLITLTRDEGMNYLIDKSSLRLMKRYCRDGRKSTEDFFRKILEF